MRARIGALVRARAIAHDARAHARARATPPTGVRCWDTSRAMKLTRAQTERAHRRALCQAAMRHEGPKFFLKIWRPCSLRRAKCKVRPKRPIALYAHSPFRALRAATRYVCIL